MDIIKNAEKASKSKKKFSADRNQTHPRWYSCSGIASSIPIRGEIFFCFLELFQHFLFSIEFFVFFYTFSTFYPNFSTILLTFDFHQFEKLTNSNLRASLLRFELMSFDCTFFDL